MLATYYRWAATQQQLYDAVDCGTSKMKMYDFAANRMGDECAVRIKSHVFEQKSRKLNINTIRSTFGHNYTFVFVYMCDSIVSIRTNEIDFTYAHTRIHVHYVYLLTPAAQGCLWRSSTNIVHWKPITYLMANDDDNKAAISLKLPLSLFPLSHSRSLYAHYFCYYYLILSIFHGRRSQLWPLFGTQSVFDSWFSSRFIQFDCLRMLFRIWVFDLGADIARIWEFDSTFMSQNYINWATAPGDAYEL